MHGHQPSIARIVERVRALGGRASALELAAELGLDLDAFAAAFVDGELEIDGEIVATKSIDFPTLPKMGPRQIEVPSAPERIPQHAATEVSARPRRERRRG